MTRQEFFESKFSQLSESEKIGMYNDYADENSYERIYEFDEATMSDIFGTDVFGAIRACHYGEVNFTDTYFQFNGYGNIETIADVDGIDFDLEGMYGCEGCWCDGIVEEMQEFDDYFDEDGTPLDFENDRKEIDSYGDIVDAEEEEEEQETEQEA